MGDTQILPTPPTAQLKTAHVMLRDLFDRFSVCGPGDERGRRTTFRELREALEIHLAIEEAVFYPAIRARNDGFARETIELALEEHRRVRELLQDVAALCAQGAPLQMAMDAFERTVLAHLDREEAQVFPQARLLSPLDQRELSRDMERMRVRLEGRR